MSRLAPVYGYLIDAAIAEHRLAPEIRTTAIARLERAVEAVICREGRVVVRARLERIAERIARDAHQEASLGRLEKVVHEPRPKGPNE